MRSSQWDRRLCPCSAKLDSAERIDTKAPFEPVHASASLLLFLTFSDMSKILLVGATGYVGGTVLSQLLASTEASFQGLTYDVLVRREHQAELLRSVYKDRINTVFWTGLEDVQSIEAIASKYDIIVNTGSGFVTAGAKAFVDGLARRVEAGLPTPWLLHISGCTNLVNLDASQQPFEWNDERDGRAIFDHMKSLDAKEPYPQRTAEIVVLETATKRGVQAISLQAPCIFGEGTGQFNRQGIVIPLVFKYVVDHGHGFKLNDTANFDWVCCTLTTTATPIPDQLTHYAGPCT